MLKRTERQIFSYDLVVNARARHAKPPPLAEIAHVWKLMYDKGICSHEREKGEVVYRIGDMSLEDDEDGVLRLLLRRCDTNAANAVYSHRHTGEPRVAERTDDEGGDRAAHLVISLQHETNKPASYLCHLEGVPGLSHRLVQATLNAVLKQAIRSESVTFSYPDPSGARLRDGSPKVTAFTPTVELIGHPSDALIQDIENGKLQNITLIDQRPKRQLGGNQYLIENEQRIGVKVAPNIPSTNRVTSIIAAIKSRKQDYQKAKIRFVDPGGVQRSIDYDIATGSPEQQNYVRSYKIMGINPPLDESSVALVPFLVERMRARVIAERT